MRASRIAFAVCLLGVSGCGDSGSSNDGGSTGRDLSAPGSDGASGPRDFALPSGDGAVTPPSSTCTVPSELTPVDTSHPTTTIGDGTPGSCTEAALQPALDTGGIVVFSCGANPVTIPFTSQKSITKDVVLDGGNLITFDGGDQTRLLLLDTGDFTKTTPTLTVQNLTFTGGHSTSQAIRLGFALQGGGGAIYHNGGRVVAIHSTFTHNRCPDTGPDVAGGAIYGIGLGETQIADCVFDANQGSNGGAIGVLTSPLTILNSTISNNVATGHGANYIGASGQMCMSDGDCQSLGSNYHCDSAHDCFVTCNADGDCPQGADYTCDTGQHKCTRELGSGGNGGGVVIDGIDSAITLCGDTVSGNQGNALGGALFRTDDDSGEGPTTLDRCTFDGNQVLDDKSGGGAFYLHGTTVHLTQTTISRNRSAGSAGGMQIDNCVLDFVNSTFSGNSALAGLAGALFLGGGNSGAIVNCTIADNHADGGPGLFSGGLFGGDAVTLTNTLVTNNTVMDGYNPINCGFSALPSGGGDFQWPMTRSGGGNDTPCTSDVTFADPLLGALGDSGGPTETMAPMSGSPAIGAGQSSCPMFDQRGMARSMPCTSGAVE